MFIKDINLKLNIAGGFAALLLLSIAIAFIVTNGMNKVIESINNADDVNRLVKYIEQARIEEKNYIMSGDDKFIKTSNEILEKMYLQVIHTKDTLHETPFIRQMDSILAAIKRYKNALALFVEIYERKKGHHTRSEGSLITIDSHILSALSEFEGSLQNNSVMNDAAIKRLFEGINDDELVNASKELITQAVAAEKICFYTRGFLKGRMLNHITFANNIMFYGAIIIILLGVSVAYFIINLITSRQKHQLIQFTDTEKLASIGRLSAGVAHEVNNPLADASLNIELLKDDFLNKEIGIEFTRKLEAIERDIDRVSSITKELLQFSRTTVTEFRPVDINIIIESALLLLKNKLKYIKITKKLQSIPEINGDPIRLEQVLLNIINNAAESLRDNGEINISSRYNKRGYIIIDIADNGCGIKVEYRSRIFDPFFTTKEVGHGTGLGLSIAYGIVSQHKGTISFVSNENIGTRMTIKLLVDKRHYDKGLGN